MQTLKMNMIAVKHLQANQMLMTHHDMSHKTYFHAHQPNKCKIYLSCATIC